jgi:hypothetical protein
MAREGRRRVLEKFDIRSTVGAHAELYRSILQRSALRVVG